MNIPSPAAVKKLTDARKEREAELASSLANVKDKMPPTKGSSKPFSKRETATASAPSASSPKGKGSRDRSSATSKDSRNSTLSTRKTTTSSSKAGRKVENSTSTTERKHSSTKPNVNAKSVESVAKKPFVRPDHLTTKPLRNNEILQKLRDSLEKPARGQFKREYRSNPRRGGKSQGLQNKKENS